MQQNDRPTNDHSVSEQSAQKSVQSAPWKRSERQSKEKLSHAHQGRSISAPLLKRGARKADYTGVFQEAVAVLRGRTVRLFRRCLDAEPIVGRRKPGSFRSAAGLSSAAAGR